MEWYVIYFSRIINPDIHSDEIYTDDVLTEIIRFMNNRIEEQLKIDAACYLLKSTDYLNKEIAEILCFSDEFHFSKTFKKKIGCSPKEYKRVIKIEGSKPVTLSN